LLHFDVNVRASRRIAAPAGIRTMKRVNRIYDNPKPIIAQATALLRSIPE
jgi:hypothetical protein